MDGDAIQIGRRLLTCKAALSAKEPPRTKGSRSLARREGGISGCRDVGTSGCQRLEKRRRLGSSNKGSALGDSETTLGKTIPLDFGESAAVSSSLIR